MANANLHSAKRAKNDEFYTRLPDIEAELKHYRQFHAKDPAENFNHFAGQTVFCNCDDPDWSNFWTYFTMNFEFLGLKKLIATHYEMDGSPSYAMILDRDPVTGAVNDYGTNADGIVLGRRVELEGNGDFRSPECCALLEESDIVVTNPPFSCYSSDTEVLTDSGWKLFADVADDDRIMSLNPDTMVSEYVAFTERTQYHVSGDLMHFANKNKDLLVTPNHRMLAFQRNGDPVRRTSEGKVDLIRADEVQASHRLPLAGFTWSGVSQDLFMLPEVTQKEQYSRREVTVPARQIDMGDWLEFFGFWLADGCVRQGVNTQGNPRYTVSIKQSEKNEAYVLKLFAGIGIEPKIVRNKTGNHNYTVYSKQLWTYLNQFGDSRAKHVPEWVMGLSSDLLQRLWDGYIAGDLSTSTTTQQRQISSVSLRLLEDMQQVYLRVFGRIAQINKTTARYRGEPYDFWAMSFTEGFNRRVTSSYGRRETVPYDDDVFCLTLERNGVMLVRRNGCVSWSGNCFREYVGQLIAYEKKFLIIGSKNAITYKEIFPLIKDNRLWLGSTPMSQDMLFGLNPEYAKYLEAEKKEGSTWRRLDGKVMGRATSCWFTNLDHKKRHEELPLFRYYADDAELFPRYDNYDAINVDRVKDIPADYTGVMGVPITFLDKHNPEQFEILNANDYKTNAKTPDKPHGLIKDKDGAIGGVPKYARILIRNLHPRPKETITPLDWVAIPPDAE